jgi:hypothetical protein
VGELTGRVDWQPHIMPCCKSLKVHQGSLCYTHTHTHTLVMGSTLQTRRHSTPHLLPPFVNRDPWRGKKRNGETTGGFSLYHTQTNTYTLTLTLSSASRSSLCRIVLSLALSFSLSRSLSLVLSSESERALLLRGTFGRVGVGWGKLGCGRNYVCMYS